MREEIYHGEEMTRHWREGDSRCCLIDRPLVIELTRQALALPGSVVDLGCGTGRWTSQLAGDAKHVLGIDRSTDMLAVARERVAANVSYIEEDIFSLERLVGLDSQALVMTLMTLQHLESGAQLAELFAQIERVLVPGGTFLALVPHPTLYASGRSGWVRTTLPADFDPAQTTEITTEIRNDLGFWTPPLRIYLHPHAAYRAALACAGLTVVQELEPVPTAAQIAERPDLAGETTPLGLIIQAKKLT